MKHTAILLFASIFTILLFVSNVAGVFADGPTVTIETIDPTDPLEGEYVTVTGEVYSVEGALESLEYQLNDTDGNWIACTLSNPRSPATLDTDFATGSGTAANGIVYEVRVDQSSEKILIGGSFTSYNGTPITRIARLNPDGSLDNSFNPGTGPNNSVVTLAIQDDGKVIIGGLFTSFNGTPVNRIARLNSDGSLDNTFDVGTGANNLIWDIVLQADGKPLIGGLFTTYNGTGRNRIALLNSDGSLDGTFSPGTAADGGIFDIELQDDGKIFIAGEFQNYAGTARSAIARLNTDGSLDNTFDPGTGINVWGRGVEVLPNGQVLISGYYTTYNSVSANSIVRVESNGARDNTFDEGTGFSIVDVGVTTVLRQTDDLYITTGWYTDYNGTASPHFTRINSDGSIDTNFDTSGGFDSVIRSSVLQSATNILLGGEFSNYGGSTANRIASIYIAHISDFSCSIDTTGLDGGDNTFYLRASDAADNTTSTDFASEVLSVTSTGGGDTGSDGEGTTDSDDPIETGSGDELTESGVFIVPFGLVGLVVLLQSIKTWVFKTWAKES